MDFRDADRHARVDRRVVCMFEIGALQRQRPRLAARSQIWQRLFDAYAALRAFDDEDQIEIAIADFADAPLPGLTAKQFADLLNIAEIVGRLSTLRLRYPAGTGSAIFSLLEPTNDDATLFRPTPHRRCSVLR